MTVRTLRGVSALALLVGVPGLQLAEAQGTTAPASPQTVTTTSTTADQPGAETSDRVVVTGSLIATKPEDAPKPVEVFTAAELEQQGSPNVTEFIRSLTLSYGV